MMMIYYCRNYGQVRVRLLGWGPKLSPSISAADKKKADVFAGMWIEMTVPFQYSETLVARHFWVCNKLSLFTLFKLSNQQAITVRDAQLSSWTTARCVSCERRFVTPFMLLLIFGDAVFYGPPHDRDQIWNFDFLKWPVNDMVDVGSPSPSRIFQVVPNRHKSESNRSLTHQCSTMWCVWPGTVIFHPTISVRLSKRGL